MKSLVIMGMVILMEISSLPLNNVRNIKDSNLSTIEDTDTKETDIEYIETDETDADFDDKSVDQETYEEQTTALNDEDVFDCKEVITEEFFKDVVSVRNIDRLRHISKQNDIDKLKNILWRFKLKEGIKPEFDENFVLGGKSFYFKYEDGTEINVSISGTMLVYNDVWYDIVNWEETGNRFYEDVALLYPEEKDSYGEDFLNCKELLSEEFFNDVEEISYSYSENILTKENEIEKFKKKLWMFKVRKSETTDSRKSDDSLVFNIKNEDGSKKKVIINEESMIIDNQCFEIVNYYEVLIEFIEGMEELFLSKE